MKRKVNITKSQIFAALFLLSLLVLLAPQVSRAVKHNPVLMGEESYYHARISRQIIEEGIPTEDNLVHGGRYYMINPYHLILASVSLLLGGILASKIIPLVCGLFSVLLFYFILKEVGFSKLNRITISIVFVLSPVFIYIFSVSTPFCIIALLDLLGFYLFMQKEKKFFIFSLVVFSIASLFSLFNLIIILIIALSYTLAFKKKKNKLYTLIFLLAAIFFFYYVPRYFRIGFLSPLEINTGLIQQFVTDLGGIFGFSIFALLLSILGFAVAWADKKKFYKTYLIMIAIIVYSFFYNSAVFYSNFIISMLAGIALGGLIKRKWKLNLIRNLSLLLLFCGLIFSAVSYTVRVSDQQPSAELMESLDWIKNNSNKEDIVFAHHTKGFWIEFQAERHVLTDSLTDSSADFKEKIDDSSKVFSSWNIEETRAILTKYNISFVLLTSDMSDGLVWDKPEQGLAYLVRNSETFKKEYSNHHAEVWSYIYHENS